MSISETTRAELVELSGRYPQARSALLPMLHLVQSEEGYVSPDGIEACARTLGLSTAEVAAVATFYTMYKRRPAGRHHVGVCTNTMCALLGGDAVWAAVSGRAGCGHDEVSEDGLFDIERIECQAACTHAPVMTVDWEFFDQATPESAVAVLDKLAAGEQVRSTRGPVVRGFRAAERTISGIDDDGLADEGGNADELMLAGLRAAAERGVGPADGAPVPEAEPKPEPKPEPEPEPEPVVAAEAVPVAAAEPAAEPRAARVRRPSAKRAAASRTRPAAADAAPATTDSPGPAPAAAPATKAAPPADAAETTDASTAGEPAAPARSRTPRKGRAR